ncbi:MAG: helicase-related protein [Candidatus Woesearchaeota archaeon]
METRIQQVTSNPVVDIALDTITKKKQALIFVNTKLSAEKCAEDIAKKLSTSTQLATDILSALPKPTKQCERLAKVIKKGIAFHHAGLVQKQRNLIEDEFRKGTIKIICCTPTLAAGVDLPAFRTIIRDLKRYTQRGYTWIPVLEYHQQAGRAGRPNFDSYGQAITLASSEQEKQAIEEHYIDGDSEDIYSKLAVEPVLRTYLLSLVAADFVSTEQQLIDFFSKTFWAHQYEDMPALTKIIHKMLRLLQEWGFLLKAAEDFVAANQIAANPISATPLGKRVAQLYLDPLTAHHILTCLKQASSKTLTSYSFLQVIASTLEIRPLLRVKTKEWEDYQEKIIQNEDSILELEPSVYSPEYEDFLNSIKTASMLNEWIEEQTEDHLLEQYSIRPGELRVKLQIADWLLYSTIELARIQHHTKLLTPLSKLRTRLKHGAKEELLPLLRLKNIGRMRARRLFTNRIRTTADIKSTDITTLSQLIGSKTALSVKEQVGQKLEQIKPTKRIGQMSLKKY